MDQPRFSSESYWERRLREHSGLQGVGFLGLGDAYNRWLYRLRRRVFLRTIRRLPVMNEHSRVLDVGSGTGFYLRLWKELGVSRIVGSDITSVAVENLTRDFPGTPIVQLDIGDSSPPSSLGRFDVVSAFDVLFHIVDDARYRDAIKGIAELLDPGGWFVFSENFVHGEAERSTHQVSRSVDEIEEILNEAGFEVVDRGPMMVLMNFPMDVRSRSVRWTWKSMAAVIGLHEVIGRIAGAMLYPIDLLLTRMLRGGPTTEICVCRKPSDDRG